MIRINLLGGERKVVAARKGFSFGDGQKITIGCSVLLIATALFVAWRYWAITQESARLDQDISASQKEAVRLRAILGQVQQFEQHKVQLQQRVTLIEQLRRGQSGPVHMVDEVSKAIPDRMWLTELSQKGDELTISGMTAALTGVSDFVSNLGASAWFSTPVDIVDSSIVQDEKTGELVKFTIKAKVKNPEAPAPPVKPAATTASAAK